MYPVFTKFWNPRCSSSWEIFDKNSPMHYTGVRNRKKGKKKSKKFQHCGFLLHKILQRSVGVYKIWRQAILGAGKSVTKTFIGEKEKMTNKRKDMHEDADSLLHDTRSRTQSSTKFQNPRYSSSWEIFDEKFYCRKRKLTNKGNDKHEDADSVLHNTTSHTQCLYQISKS